MKWHALINNIFIAILLIPFTVIGCGTAKSLYDSAYNKVANPVIKRARPVKDGLKKRVLFLPVIDQAGIGEAKARKISTRFLDRLEADGRFLVTEASLPAHLKRKISSPRLGTIVDPDLAKWAEEKGMNVLLIPVLPPFETYARFRGIWPIRGIKREMEISMVVNALDITNGTLFISNQESVKIKLPSDIEDEKRPEEYIDEKKIDKNISRILDRQASAVISKLKSHPWSGRVLSANKDKVIINAGEDIGITSGRIFDVFDRGELIPALNGGSFYLLGPKIGEIKTVEVRPNYSSAVPLASMEIKAGQVIKVKN